MCFFRAYRVWTPCNYLLQNIQNYFVRKGKNKLLHETLAASSCLISISPWNSFVYNTALQTFFHGNSQSRRWEDGNFNISPNVLQNLHHYYILVCPHFHRLKYVMQIFGHKLLWWLYFVCFCRIWFEPPKLRLVFFVK